MNNSYPPLTPIDDIARIFNTALVTTRVAATKDVSAELRGLVDSAAFRAILASVKQLARLQGISEKESAETIIHLFRKLDLLWGEYLLQEGAGRIRNDERAN